jgi:cytochrome oxidase assembly protein ShyY1
MKNRIFIFFSILAIILCAYLGVWQIQRYHYKVSRTTNFQNSIKTPARLKSDFSNIKDFEIYQVKGRFLFDKQIFIGPRRRHKKNGFFVFTAFQKTNGQHLIVNRGFIKDTDLDFLRTGTSPILNLNLIARYAKNKPWYLPENNIAERKLHYVNLSQISDLLKITEPPLYFVSISNDYMKQEKLEELISKDYKFFNPHKKYVYFWFLMSLTILVMLVFYRRKNN